MAQHQVSHQQRPVVPPAPRAVAMPVDVAAHHPRSGLAATHHHCSPRSAAVPADY